MSNRKDVMTPEEFLSHCSGGSEYYRDKGKSRLNRARSWYEAYRSGHQAATLSELLRLHIMCTRPEQSAVLLAARERDAGVSMVIVEEFQK